FRAMDIRILQGRSLLDSDAAGSPRVVVISANLAKKYFSGENPIGRRIRIDNDAARAPREIVGVVADVKHSSLDGEAAPHVYEPLPQAPSTWLTFVLRATVEPMGLATAARAAVAGATRLLSGLLYGVSPTDPVTYASVAALLTAVSLVACLVPARRATRVDPVTALRYE